MSMWPLLRLTKYVDDLTMSHRGMNRTVATVITEAVSSMVGWLENGLDFHVSKDEEGVEGKSVVLVSNASLKAALTSATKALGMRVVSHARILGVDAYGAGAARQRRTQYARLTKIKKRMPKVQFYKKYGAVTSKVAKAELMPSGRAHGGMGGGSVGRAAGRCRSAQDLETTAATGGLEAVVEQGQWPDGCHHYVSEAAGMDMASPHDLRHCEWTRGGLTADLPQGRQSASDDGQ